MLLSKIETLEFFALLVNDRLAGILGFVKRGDYSISVSCLVDMLIYKHCFVFVINEEEVYAYFEAALEENNSETFIYLTKKLIIL